jgi:pimeloyl-ACP methyl ester carboxylesterase
VAGAAAPTPAAPAGNGPDDPGPLQHRDVAGKLRPCLADATHRCGHIRQPLDPHHPKAGKIKIHFELIRRDDRRKPSLGTIVAVEGGPGYATTWSRSSYEDLFEPLLDRRQLLLVDQRGTGRSGPILCRQLQAYRGNRVNAVGKCGRQLGDASDVYGSRIAADDMDAVLDHLGIGRVDLYGDSYGTFFSQAFAVRHPEHVRTLTLDAAYFVGGTDPWYSDTNRALRHAFNVACKRSRACAAHRGAGMSRIRDLARLLRRHSLHGRAPNTAGVVGKVVVTQNRLIDLLTGAATNPTIYRELDAAAAAATRDNRYLKPLLRLVREVQYHGGAGPYRLYSEGMYLAVSCNDYPQPFDFTSPVAKRPRQFQHQVNELRRSTPRIFGPFTVKEWVRSPYGYYDDCLKWPAPSRWIHPVPRKAVYPDVPVLVLDGDLDSLTSPEGARDTAAHFPNATFVETANMTHVSAISDYDQCASLIVRRFVRTKDPGNTSCASRYHENRLVGRYARTADGTGWSPGRMRSAKIANATLADVMARWWASYAHHGAGLLGGTFGWNGAASRPGTPIIRWNLDGVQWVRDVTVSGTMRWNRRSGAVSADVIAAGSATAPATLHLRWNDLERHARAKARGTVGGTSVRLSFPSA